MKYLYSILILTATVIWLALFYAPDDNLHLIACDVGQGDAILAIYKDTQFLIDGGPNNKVIDCLSRHMPFWDRKIEVVLNTHPQKDHYMGLIDVFKRYEVGIMVTTKIASSSQEYKVLERLVGGGGTKVMHAKEGQRIGNSTIYLDIVYPQGDYLSSLTCEDNDKNVENVLGTCISGTDPNDFSIISILKFKDFDALLTGDMGYQIEDDLINSLDNSITFEYLKVPHHGSKNGLSKEFLQTFTPKVAVISVGKNQWGHPHTEVLEMLKEERVETYRTDESRDVEIVTDGSSFWGK